MWTHSTYIAYYFSFLGLTVPPPGCALALLKTFGYKRNRKGFSGSDSTKACSISLFCQLRSAPGTCWEKEASERTGSTVVSLAFIFSSNSFLFARTFDGKYRRYVASVFHRQRCSDLLRNKRKPNGVPFHDDINEYDRHLYSEVANSES